VLTAIVTYDTRMAVALALGLAILAPTEGAADD